MGLEALPRSRPQKGEQLLCSCSCPVAKAGLRSRLSSGLRSGDPCLERTSHPSGWNGIGLTGPVLITIRRTAAYCRSPLRAFQQLKKPFLGKAFSPLALAKPGFEPIGSRGDDTECQPASPVHPVPHKQHHGETLRLRQARGKAGRGMGGKKPW